MYRQLPKLNERQSFAGIHKFSKKKNPGINSKFLIPKGWHGFFY